MKSSPVHRHGASSQKINLLLDAAHKKYKKLIAVRNWSAALEASLQACKLAPGLALTWTEACVCCVLLERWQDAIGYGERALQCEGKALSLFDAMAHAHGALGQWERAQFFGLKALNQRAEMFGGQAPLPHTAPQTLPPKPSAATRQKNVIAFSLYGGQSKYCETAILNVSEVERIYPHWICRFYVDTSVPAEVIQRLEKNGAQVLQIDPAYQKWPGTMWRFLTYDDIDVHRVLFRDADSVVSEREAQAVAHWVDSDKLFHMIRDSGSHTELMLAGLWGVVAGALPSMTKLIVTFLQKPLESQHFADQFFLRSWVWPYARKSVLHHDSIFGFMNAQSLSGDRRALTFHIGYAEGATTFSVPTKFADNTMVCWSLIRFDNEAFQTVPKIVCSYPAIVKNNAVTDNLPQRYADKLRTGEMQIKIDLAV